MDKMDEFKKEMKKLLPKFSKHQQDEINGMMENGTSYAFVIIRENIRSRISEEEKKHDADKKLLEKLKNVNKLAKEF